MNSLSLTLHERKYIRSRVKKTINESVKRKIAQRIVEHSYQKHNFDNYLASLPKEDLRGIIETYDTHKDLIKLGVKIIQNKIASGGFTKSKADVNYILREHKVINKKGLLRESMGEFALDMLFGIAPAIASLPPVIAATGGASATVGVGLGVAGMIYYGYKFSKDLSVKNTLGMIINGMSFIFSAAEVFPMVGTAVAFVGKQIMRVLKAVFGGLFKLVAVPLKGLFKLGGSALAKLEIQGISKIIAAGGEGAGKSLIPFIEKAGLGTAAELEKLGAEELIKMGEKIIAGGGTSKVLSETTKSALAETGKEAIKNADKFKSLGGILGKGAGLMEKATEFLAKLAAKATELPLIGKFAGAIEQGLLAIEKNTATILANSERVSAAVAQASEKKLSEAGTGALINAAANIEKEGAREILKNVMASEAKVGLAAKEMGLLQKMGIDLEKGVAGAYTKEIAKGGEFALIRAEGEAAEFAQKFIANNMKTLESSAGKKLAQNMDDLIKASITGGRGLETKALVPFFQKAEKEILEATLGLADEAAQLTTKAGNKLIAGSTIKEFTKGSAKYTVSSFKMGERGLEVVVKSAARPSGSIMTGKQFINFAGPQAKTLIDDVGKEVAEQLATKAAGYPGVVAVRKGLTKTTVEVANKMAEESSRYLAKGGNNTIAMFAALSGAHPKALEKVVINSVGAIPKISSSSVSTKDPMANISGMKSGLTAKDRQQQLKSLYGKDALAEAIMKKSLSILY